MRDRDFDDLVDGDVEGTNGPEEDARLRALAEADESLRERLAAHRRAARELAAAGAVEPPAGLADAVMEEVRGRAEERAVQPSEPTRVIAFKQPIVGGDRMASRKALVGIAAAAVVAIGYFAVQGFPPVGPGTEGTIGAAKRHQSQQIGAQDVQVASESQDFLQSEVFHQIVNDPQLRKALSDPKVQAALADSSLRESMSKLAGNDAYRQYATNDAVANLVTSDAMRVALDNAALREALGREDYEAAIASYAARMGGNKAGDAQRALLSFQDAMKVPAFRDAMRNSDFRALLANQSLRNALSNEKFNAALRGSSAFRYALTTDSFRYALASEDAYRSLLSAELQSKLSGMDAQRGEDAARAVGSGRVGDQR